MHLDVVDLRRFYYRTGLGRSAQRAIQAQIAEIWAEPKEETIVGYGFAVPVLRPFLTGARRVTALMPGQQGVSHWPPGAPNVSVLCHEVYWPVETASVDKLILLHGLETSENPSAVLEESWRVLAPGGRALFIVPNRSGLWSRRDATPFGFGRPYSLSQLEAQLKRHHFLPEHHRAALFQPPSEKRFWMRTGKFWERLGQKLPKGIAGGVIMVEVTKQVSAPKRPGLPTAVRKPLDMLEGIGKANPKPV
jgi:SAM-dependent methyltransferase